MSGIRWTQEEWTAYLQRRIFARENSSAISAADVESTPQPIAASENVDEEVHPRFRIHVHSRRRRLADPDGISVKAAIDGLVKGGILRDDSAKYISAVTFTQEFSKLEETIIEVWQEA